MMARPITLIPKARQVSSSLNISDEVNFLTSYLQRVKASIYTASKEGRIARIHCSNHYMLFHIKTRQDFCPSLVLVFIQYRFLSLFSYFETNAKNIWERNLVIIVLFLSVNFTVFDFRIKIEGSVLGDQSLQPKIIYKSPDKIQSCHPF
ncbi:Uncharacterised protein [Streptococcus mutans]|nr:Uncharacterised protein [Streptococcus mutans]